MSITWPGSITDPPPVWTFASWEALEQFVDDWFASDQDMVVTCVPPAPGLAGAFFHGEPVADGARPFALYRVQR